MLQNFKLKYLHDFHSIFILLMAFNSDLKGSFYTHRIHYANNTHQTFIGGPVNLVVDADAGLMGL